MPYATNPLVPIVLRPQEVAAILGLSVWSVHRLMRVGRLPCVKVGRRYLVRAVDLAAFLDPSATA